MNEQYPWMAGLSKRVRYVLLQSRILTKEELLGAVLSGRLSPAKGSARNYGPLAHKEVCAFLGIPCTNKSIDILRHLYNELIFSVVRKFPGESRHETALRYIRESESVSSSESEEVSKQ